MRYSHHTTNLWNLKRVGHLLPGADTRGDRQFLQLGSNARVTDEDTYPGYREDAEDLAADVKIDCGNGLLRVVGDPACIKRLLSTWRTRRQRFLNSASMPNL